MRRRRAAMTTTVGVAAAFAVIATVTGTGPATAASSRVGPVKEIRQVKSSADKDARAELARRLGIQTVPKRPGVTRKAAGGVAEANPYTALTPDPASVDMSFWRAKLKAQGKQRAAALARKAATKAVAEPLLVDEQEPAAVRGGNDTPANAQLISPFGTGSGKRAKARILGTEAPPAFAADFATKAEDNGAIPLAGTVPVTSGTQRVASSRIGDGPHGSAGDGSGDFDFYKFSASAGQRLRVAIDARQSNPSSGLDSLVILWDKDGNALAANDDGPTSLDSLLETTIPAAGTYYVSVSDYRSFPGDPFDSGSGASDPEQGEGDYSVTFGLNASDIDYYSFNLKAGDVLSGTVKGVATTLSVLNPSKTEVFGSSQDASSIYPASTPLTGGGNATVDHVAATAGKYYLGVIGGVGTYDVDLEVFRPKLEAGATQTIFLDFNGQKLNTNIVGGRGVTTLSPLSAFLGRWNIPASQQNALIDRIVSTVTENLKKDFAGTGVAVKILNSRDDADPFGKANVSRLIIGGTIEESGVDTIGIAQSIDPGNFDTRDTALILLDVVSDLPNSDYDSDPSFNAYITPASNKVKFVGTALGNIASHEAGHFLGNWHVDQFNTKLNLMDQGGNFPLLYGVGADGVGGTADDPDIDFGSDTLNPNEGFTGTENTRARTQWGLHGLL